MQSDKMCPVTLGNYKTKTPIGRHPWQPPTPAGFEQGVPWRSPCEHSNSSRIRAHATQNAVRQNAFRYLRSRLQHQQASKLWISSRILCNNFLGALPLTPKEGSADILGAFACLDHHLVCSIATILKGERGIFRRVKALCYANFDTPPHFLYIMPTVNG